jgi:hypothetical protein
VLHERLLPYAERTALGPLEGCTGSVSRSLGLLATVTSRFDEATRHFEEAIDHNRRMRALPWLAHTQHEFAAMLLKRAGDGDGERAIELLGAALRTCDELGMPALRARVVATLADLGAAAPAPPTGTVAAVLPAAEAGTMRLEGEYWSAGYDGRVLRLRDSKGLRILAHLLAGPDRPFASLDLERLGAAGDDAVARAVASSDAGEVLDDEARRAYRARLGELQEAIEEAEAWGKADQTGAMREEMDFITHELAGAFGLGGRARHAGSTTERARLNVTRAVKSAIRRIAAVDPALAAHLEATVRTGTVCSYSPDPRTPIAWRVSAGGVHPD